ncbi:MAG: YbhN family protein [Acidobacteriia bacterium]|nr:YbhN family protein [Terriglobia bacterium]
MTFSENNTSAALDFESAPPLPPRPKLRRYLLLLVFLGLVLYLFLPRISAMQHELVVLASLRIPFVMLAVAAQIISYLGSGYLLRAVVNLSPRPVSVMDGALVTLGANSVGTLGGGALGTAGMTYFWLRRRGANRGAAGLGGWIPIFLNLAVLALASLGGLLVLIRLKKSSTVLAAGLTLVTLVLAVGMGTLVWCLTHREKLGGIITAVAAFLARLRRKPVDHSKIETTVEHLLAGWDGLVQGGWRGPALGAVLNTGFDMLTLCFLFWAAGYRAGAAMVLAGYGLPQLVGKSTVILGGAGLVETSMAALYVIIGVPHPTAIVVVLGYRLLSFWLPTLIGTALVPFLSKRGEALASGERPMS